MACVACGSAAVTERPEHTARGYRRFRCRDCGKQSNERSGTLLNHAQYPSDVVALVVLWRLRYRLTLRDLGEMFLIRGIVFSHEAVRSWEAKLAPVLAGEPRRHRHAKGGARGRHWHVDETDLKVRGRWACLYRAVDRDGRLVDIMLSERRDMAAARAFFRSARSATGLVPDRVTTDGHGSLRWSPSVGQFDGSDKLGPGFRQAANLVASSAPYASSGVCPARAVCGRPAL